jgi:L-iditol 2-dehydrogenase
MKQVIIAGPHSLELREATEPRTPRDGVLVDVEACGICTLEQRHYRGARRQYPFAAGHEVSGRVRDVRGPGQTTKVGDIVAVSLLPRCGSCNACRRGYDHLCTYTLAERSDVSDPAGPGGMAEVVAASQRDIVVMNDCADVALAALTEPVACVISSLRQAAVRAGCAVAILGSGFMGQLHRMLLEAMGVRTLMVRYPRELSTPLTDSLRKSHDLDGPIDVHRGRTVHAWAEPYGGLAAIVCTQNVDSVVKDAFMIADPGSRIVIFFSASAFVETIDLAEIRRKGLVLLTSASFSRDDFREAARQVVSLGDSLRFLQRKRYSLPEVEEAFAYAITHPGERVVVMPQHRAPQECSRFSV